MPYRCPVCHTGDPNAYLRCHRPDCTYGRDQRPRIIVREAPPRKPDRFPMDGGIRPAPPEDERGTRFEGFGLLWFFFTVACCFATGALGYFVGRFG